MSRSAEQSQALGPREVHLWYSQPEHVEDDAHIAQLRGLLSQDEQERYQRFWFDQHRHHFLVAHALVRTTLSRYARVPPEAWHFTANRYGRPEIVEPKIGPPLRFNLSHTDGLVVCAIVQDREIGVDVENTQRPDADLKIARRFFSPAEVADLEALEPVRQREAFFDYWTLKEAYIKARGMGLAIPLKHFSFHLTAQKKVEISFVAELKDDPARWQFAQLRPTECHLISIAVERFNEGDLDIVARDVVP